MSDRFRKEYKPLTPEQQQAINQVKDLAEQMLKIMEENTLDSRYFSLGRTALEESVMWTVKGFTA